MAIANPNRRDIMEPGARDEEQPLLQAACLTSMVMPAVVTVTPSVPSSRESPKLETDDTASVTAIKSPTTDREESPSPISESPSSPFGEPLGTKAACTYHDLKPTSALKRLARIYPDQYFEEQDSKQLRALGETDSADPIGHHFFDLFASYETQWKGSPDGAESTKTQPFLSCTREHLHATAYSSEKASSKATRLPRVNQKCLGSKRRELSTLLNHSVGGRLKKGFRKLVNFPSKSWHRRPSIITSTSAGSHGSMMRAEPGKKLHIESATHTEADGPYDEEASVDTSLDSSASSPAILQGNSFSDSVLSLSSTCMRPFAPSITNVSSTPDLKFPLLGSQRKLLEDKLEKLAIYGLLLRKTGSIDLSTLKEIGHDLGVVSQNLSDPEVMQQMCESGMLKEMVDTELLRRALEFFHLWVDLEALEDAKAEPSPRC